MVVTSAPFHEFTHPPKALYKWSMTGKDASRSLASSLVAVMLFVSAGCSGTKHPVVEDLVGHEDLALFRVQSLSGVRDGDRLRAQALISDTSSILTMEMQFAIGSPTRLDSGTWRWARN